MKALIVNADDFGLTEGINRGIIKAYRKGIVTSTTLIANGRAFDHAVSLARENRGLKIGIHLTLVEEEPVAKKNEVPSLIRMDGFFRRNYLSLFSHLLMRKLKLEEVRREFRAQIEKCLASNIIPTHIDSHQYVHVISSILDIVIELAKEYGIFAARCPDEKTIMIGDRCITFSTKNAKRWGLSLLARRARKKFQRNGILTSDNFFGMLHSGRLNSEMISAMLMHLQSGTTELACHPGFLDTELISRYRHWEYNWERELEALTDHSIMALIKRLDIKLINFSHLATYKITQDHIEDKR